MASGLALAARGKLASEVMSKEVVTIRGTAPVAEALKIMIERVIKVLPVVDAGGRFIGTLNRSALLAALARGSGNGHAGSEA